MQPPLVSTPLGGVSSEAYDEFAPRIAMLKQAAARGNADFQGGQQQARRLFCSCTRTKHIL